jgi:hypothetical protein
MRQQAAITKHVSLYKKAWRYRNVSEILDKLRNRFAPTSGLYRKINKKYLYVFTKATELYMEANSYLGPAITIGFDFAREGGDDSVVFIRKGMRLISFLPQVPNPEKWKLCEYNGTIRATHPEYGPIEVTDND